MISDIEQKSKYAIACLFFIAFPILILNDF
jgi:hypothetical protein